MNRRHVREPTRDGVIYVAQHRRRGSKLLIWTRVPVAPGGDCRRAFFASRAGRGASLP